MEKTKAVFGPFWFPLERNTPFCYNSTIWLYRECITQNREEIRGACRYILNCQSWFRAENAEKRYCRIDSVGFAASIKEER